MPNKEIKEQVDRQNVVIGFILGCLLVGGIVLMCMILL